MKKLLRRMWREFTGQNIDPEVARVKRASLPLAPPRPKYSGMAALEGLTGNLGPMVTERAVQQSASMITQAIIDSAQYREHPGG